MKRLLAVFCAVAALVASPAAATPPDVIVIEDQLFALGEDKVFVLRSSFDNLGVYHASYREAWLVGIDVASGEETMWLVYRGRTEDMSAIDPDDGRIEVTLMDREAWHDPMQIIGDAGAELVVGERRHAADDSPLVPDGDGNFLLEDDYWPTFTWQRDEALAQAGASVAVFAGHIADVPRMAPISTREMLEGRGVIEDSCAFYRLGFPRGSGAEAYQLVEVRCADEDVLEFTSVIQAISPS